MKDLRVSPAEEALAFLPRGLFLMTATFEGKRAGVLVSSVQSMGGEPPLISVAIRKGHWIEPLVRDSRAFGLCILDPGDRLVTKKFGDATRPREGGDPFDCLPVERLATGAPIVRRCLAAMDCEVARHIDIEVEYALYVGYVRASRVYANSPSRIQAN